MLVVAVAGRVRLELLDQVALEVAAGAAAGTAAAGAGADAGKGAEAAALSPSMIVGWRSHARPSGVNASPARTPIRKIAVKALMPARKPIPD